MLLDDETIAALGYARCELGLDVSHAHDGALFLVAGRTPRAPVMRWPSAAKIVPPDERRARWRAAKQKQRENPAYVAKENERAKERRPRKRPKRQKLTAEERRERRRLAERKRREAMSESEREAIRARDRERVRRARERAGIEVTRAQNRKDQRARRERLRARATASSRLEQTISRAA